jgi:hypothetical protein
LVNPNTLVKELFLKENLYDDDILNNIHPNLISSEKHGSIKAQRLSMRMSAKTPIYVHENLNVIHPKETFDSSRNVINTIEFTDPKAEGRILNHFKRNSIAITNIALEKEKEKLIKSKTNK